MKMKGSLARSIDPVQAAVDLHDRAVEARSGGRPAEAEALCRRSLDVLEQALGPDHPDVASVLLCLAGTFEDRSRYAEAESHYQRSVAILEQASADGDVQRLRVQALGHLGSIHRARGCYAEAEPLLRRALAVAEESFGADDLEVSGALNNLAVLYKYTGRFNEAGRLYQRALAITEKALGLEHVEVATIYHNLGGLEHSAGNYLRGEPFARRSLEIREKALGPNHPDVAADVAALAVFERAFGPEHYEIAVNLNNLAALRQARGDAEQAEALYRRALDLKEKLLGRDHPDVAMTLNNLAVLLKSRRRLAEAEPLYRRALEIFEKALGPGHRNVATCLVNYGQLLRKLKRGDEARELEARARRAWSGLDTVAEDVAVTATINPQLACFRLAVRPSPIHRFGVFAEEPIPARRKVIEYAGQRIGRNEGKRRRARSFVYLFKLDDYWWIDGATGGSGAETINHSCEPNLFARCIRRRIFYFSTRRIEPGEELKADYKLAGGARVLCRCGAASCRGTVNLKQRGRRSPSRARATRHG